MKTISHRELHSFRIQAHGSNALGRDDDSLCFSTETKVESGTSQSKSGTSVNVSNSGFRLRIGVRDMGPGFGIGVTVEYSYRTKSINLRSLNRFASPVNSQGCVNSSPNLGTNIDFWGEVKKRRIGPPARAGGGV